MAYTAERPLRKARPSDELRRTVHGWGVDLDPKDRAAVPKENFNPGATGAHWDFPERQVERWPREKTPEHKFLTPVFGTSCPPKGLSGMIRRYAYRYSEGRLTHWLLLILGDRVDVLESRATAILRGHPDNPFAEAGLRSEWRRGGLRSRTGQHRADLKHQPLDLLLAAVPWVVGGFVVYKVGSAVMNAMDGSRDRGPRRLGHAGHAGNTAGPRGPRYLEQPRAQYH